MDASERELLTAALFFQAAFPVMKVPLEDDPRMKKKFRNVSACIQFSADNNGDTLGCCLIFDKGELRVVQDLCEKPDIVLHFSSVKKMNTMLSGGAALPKIKGLFRLGLLVKVMGLLLSLMLMMPSSRPKDPLKKYLKVKMSLYMITTALSRYNKLGAPDMTEWTKHQPDRIYQFTVNDDRCEEPIAAYLRVKAGKTKAGRGTYTRRKPFVHFQFNGIDGALKVLLKDVEFVEGVEKNCVVVDGAPEYSARLNDFMAVLQGMMT